MAVAREVVLERARKFEQATGQHVDVEWPSRQPINVDPEGPFMSFMALSLGRREVHLYSHRLQANPPSIHFVETGDKTRGSERKRVMGRPGCRIERRPGGGFLLLDAAAARDEPHEISVDDVAYKAFQLLLAME